MKCPKCGYEPTIEEIQYEMETLTQSALAYLALAKRAGLSLDIKKSIIQINKLIKVLQEMTTKKLVETQT